jgi:hypothetical protein
MSLRARLLRIRFPTRREWTGVAPGLTALLVAAGSSGAAAGAFEGRIALEMEYLGESYRSEQSLTAEELGLPPGTTLVFAETTRFQDDAWHPGPRLDLAWRGGSRGRTRELTSNTMFNSERFSQEMEITGAIPVDGGRWRWRAHGGFRDEERSLVGDGDWRAGLEASREARFGRDLRGELRASWEHSRTRGDSVSYLYDYDLARARLRVGESGGWLPIWELFAEGAAKSVPAGEPGAYTEARLSGLWRPGAIGEGVLTADLRVRDYRLGASPGRDMRSAELAGRTRLLTRSSARIEWEANLEASDYSGEDALYFDSAVLTLHVPWTREVSGWSWTAGPAAARLQDLGGGNRGYTQWTAQGTASRFLNLTGFGELHLEAGYRDYGDGDGSAIEVTSLSASVLRSDYWLLDALLTLSLPVRDGLFVEAFGSTSWEFHPTEAERIQVTLVTLGVVRTF